MNALVPIQNSNVEIYRTSTDAAALCKEIVVASALDIQGRKYVRVEGWQAIAIAHGCTGSAREVERVEGGVRAIGEIRRMSDGAVIAEAEGFVGEDEPTWFGGVTQAWKWGEKRGEKVWYEKTLEKRPDYAIRAMAQTRAISRACRSAFAHVVVMMNAGLSTTPAEEVPLDSFDERTDAPRAEAPRNVTPDKPKAEPQTVGAAQLDTEMDACKSKDALLAWEQSRLKEIGRLSKADGDKLCVKFRDLLASLPEKAAQATDGAGDALLDDEIKF